MKEKLLQSFSHLLDSVIAAAPKVVVGILLVVVGLVVAKIVEVVLRFILVRVRFDSLVEKAGIDKALQRIGLRQQLNLFIPRLVYFLTILLLAKTASDALAGDHFQRHRSILLLFAKHHCGALAADPWEHGRAICRTDGNPIGGEFRNRLRSLVGQAGLRPGSLLLWP